MPWPVDNFECEIDFPSRKSTFAKNLFRGDDLIEKLISASSSIQALFLPAGSILGIVLGFKALYEYQRNNRYRRVEYYLKFRERFEKTFMKYLDVLENDCLNSGIKLTTADKIELIGFCEDLALAFNTRLINLEVASYMFGYYVIKCWQWNELWIHDGFDWRHDPVYTQLKIFIDYLLKFKPNSKYSCRISI